MSKLKIDFWDFSGLSSINPTGLNLTADNIIDMSILEHEPVGRVMCVEDAVALYYKHNQCESNDVDRETAKQEIWFDRMKITVTD